MSLRCALFDLENAYKKFFKEKIGFPKYKSKYQKNSYRTNFVTSMYKGSIYQNIKLDMKNKIIGIDLGIKDLVITSDYEKYENNKIIQKYEKRIKRIQRNLSKVITIIN